MRIYAVRAVVNRIGVVRPRRRFVIWLVTMALGAVFLMAATLLGPALFEASAVDWDGWHGAGHDTGRSLQDAVRSGQETDLPLFTCRAVINSDVHVGRVRSDFGGCHIGFNGREVEIAPYEALSVVWRPGTDPLGSALIAGSERAASPETPFETTPLYVCRAAFQGGLHTGQVRLGEKACSFGFGGRRMVASTYDVLQMAPWLTWTRATARNLPDTAIVSGSEGGESFYACRAADREGLRPGKIKQNAMGCSIASDGREVTAERFEILTARWITGRAGIVPVSAYTAGREAGNPQYICRAQTRDTMQVGKVNEALGGCHVGMLGREVVMSDYEVLSQ